MVCRYRSDIASPCCRIYSPRVHDNETMCIYMLRLVTINCYLRRGFNYYMNITYNMVGNYCSSATTGLDLALYGCVLLCTMYANFYLRGTYSFRILYLDWMRKCFRCLITKSVLLLYGEMTATVHTHVNVLPHSFKFILSVT